MVIQANMSPRAVVDIWGNTIKIFKKYNIPVTGKSLDKLIEADMVTMLLIELNDYVNSSADTCIEGG